MHVKDVIREEDIDGCFVATAANTIHQTRAKIKYVHTCAGKQVGAVSLT